MKAGPRLFSRMKHNPLIFIVGTALWIFFTGNIALFKRLFEIYPLSGDHVYFLLSVLGFFLLTTVIFFLVIGVGKLTHWILGLFLILSALAGYYMQQFGVVIDVVMLDNVAQTHTAELTALLTPALAIQLLFLGLGPAWLLIKHYPALPTPIPITQRLRWLGCCLLGIILLVVPFTADYAYFIREHKITRCFANPTFYTYSVIKYLEQTLHAHSAQTITHTALDAKRIRNEISNELVIMVVGETARADRFALNGYHRPTNPELMKEQLISFKNVSSCGTSTGVSVPCMFSILGRKAFDKEKALHMENALDVLYEHGVEVLWRDNNSDSKGVATRLTYEDFQSPSLNTVCDEECRDVGMIQGLEKFIQTHPNKDILIVLHQMGNHGPEYYRRYPPSFEYFKPACKTGELSRCSTQEIDNAYDNAIRYTDYFLSQVIQFLKQYDQQYATAMLYVSDHGESLGEHGFYLHAAPYAMAPKEQTHIPALVWMGSHFDYRIEQLKPYEHAPLSHDYVFCALLTSFEIETASCNSHAFLAMYNREYQAANTAIKPPSNTP